MTPIVATILGSWALACCCALSKTATSTAMSIAAVAALVWSIIGVAI